jgi:hypothetical protein
MRKAQWLLSLRCTVHSLQRPENKSEFGGNFWEGLALQLRAYNTLFHTFVPRNQVFIVQLCLVAICEKFV